MFFDYWHIVVAGIVPSLMLIHLPILAYKGSQQDNDDECTRPEQPQSDPEWKKQTLRYAF